MPENRSSSLKASPRLAVIDIGSNSVRMMVAEVDPAGTDVVLAQRRESTRLGRALNSTGCLAAEAIDASLAALGRFRQLAEQFGVQTIRAIATCAVREAANGEELVRRTLEETGLSVEVISATHEAELAFESVRRNIDLHDRTVMLADIGGGSTELVLATGANVGSEIEAIYPLPLGAVRLGERFPECRSTSDDHFARSIRAVDECLASATQPTASPPDVLFGTGGTFSSLAAMHMAAENDSVSSVHGYQLSRSEFEALFDRLCQTSYDQRIALDGLNPDRADIIVPGLAIVDGILRRFQIDLIQVHGRGVRDGMLLKMIDELSG